MSAVLTIRLKRTDVNSSGVQKHCTGENKIRHHKSTDIWMWLDISSCFNATADDLSIGDKKKESSSFHVKRA